MRIPIVLSALFSRAHLNVPHVILRTENDLNEDKGKEGEEGPESDASTEKDKENDKPENVEEEKADEANKAEENDDDIKIEDNGEGNDAEEDEEELKPNPLLSKLDEKDDDAEDGDKPDLSRKSPIDELLSRLPNCVNRGGCSKPLMSCRWLFHFCFLEVCPRQCLETDFSVLSYPIIDLIDAAATDYCYINTKKAKKRLIKGILNVPRFVLKAGKTMCI